MSSPSEPVNPENPTNTAETDAPGLLPEIASSERGWQREGEDDRESAAWQWLQGVQHDLGRVAAGTERLVEQSEAILDTTDVIEEVARRRHTETVMGFGRVVEAVEKLGPKRPEPIFSTRDTELGIDEETPRNNEEAQEAALVADALSISLANSHNAHPRYLATRLDISDDHALELMRELARRGYIENPIRETSTGGSRVQRFSEGTLDLHPSQSLKVQVKPPQGLSRAEVSRTLRPYIDHVRTHRLTDAYIHIPEPVCPVPNPAEVAISLGLREKLNDFLTRLPYEVRAEESSRATRIRGRGRLPERVTRALGQLDLTLEELPALAIRILRFENQLPEEPLTQQEVVNIVSDPLRVEYYAKSLVSARAKSTRNPQELARGICVPLDCVPPRFGQARGASRQEAEAGTAFANVLWRAARDRLEEEGLITEKRLAKNYDKGLLN